MKKAVFGGGCFWCLEALFQKVEGVMHVVSGYSGGEVENPTYEAVCSGKTGHAEVVEVAFDEKVISYETLLDLFFVIHDPTTLNRQGNDIGTQYRSVIYYLDEQQKEHALEKREELSKSMKVVTEIEPLNRFYPAESYHQNYYNDNPQNPYCTYVITPKIEKFFN